MQSLIDLVNMAKWLINESQQTSVTHKNWEDCSPVYEVEGGEVKAVSFFLWLVLVNHLLQQLIQIILVLQHGLPQTHGWKNIGIKSNIKETTEVYVAQNNLRKTPSKFAILSRVKPSDFRFVTFLTEHLWWLLLLIHVISQVWSPTTVVWSFLNKKVSYFEPFQSRPKGIIRLWNRAFEASMSKKTCAKLCLKKWSGH